MSLMTDNDISGVEAAAGGPRTEHPAARRRTGLLILGTLALLALGVLGNWPFLAAEHTRMEPAHRWLVWAADGTALAWMLWFGLGHCAFGIPERNADRTFRWALLTLMAGLAADTAGTALLAYREESGNERKVPARQAQLTGGRTSLNGELAYVHCRFQDQSGTWHETRLCLHLVLHPPALQDAARKDQYPIPVQVTHDPDWPPRCWVTPEDAGGTESLYAMLLCVLVFQGMLIGAAALHAWTGQSRSRMPIYRIIPVWGVMLPLGCGALGKLLSGEL